MALLISIVLLAMVGLIIFQAWQFWFLRRELARLEQRVAESLDDQDLLEFQDRLKGLLTETKDAGLSLVETIERRREALDKVLSKAVEAEKALSVRVQLLELVAKDISKLPTSPPKPALPKARPSAPRKSPVKTDPEPLEAPPNGGEASEAQVREEAAEEARRSYLSRPTAPTVAGPSRYQRVYELADQGLTREQIAREAGLLPGEVELILNLRPGKRRPS
jgi:hypothetical protein